MTHPKTTFYRHSLRLALAFSLSATSVFSSGNPEDQFVNNLLEHSRGSMAELAREAVTTYQPFVDVRSTIEQHVIEAVTPSISASYLSRKLVDPKIIQDSWAKAEAQVSHPLLKAVCIFQQYEVSRNQATVMKLHEELVEKLMVASEVGDKETHFKLRMMAARQAEQINEMALRIGYEYGTKPDFIAHMSRLILLPAELWRGIVEDKTLFELKDHALYKLFPKRVLNESWNAKRYLIEELGFESIEERVICENSSREVSKTPETKTEDRRIGENRRFLEAVFKAFCLYRASGFDGWNYRYRANTRLSENAVESIVPDIKRMLKSYKSTAKAIDEMVVLLPVSTHTPVLLQPGAEGSWRQYCKFRLTALAAEIRSIPSGILKNKSMFSSLPRLKEDEVTLIREASEDMEPILKRTHKKVLGFIDADELLWGARLVLVRSIHDLAMFETDKAKQLQELKKAHELSKLREGEYDPTPLSLTDDNRGLHRYPHSDLQSRNGDFLTWETALEFKIKQLEHPKEN